MNFSLLAALEYALGKACSSLLQLHLSQIPVSTFTFNVTTYIDS